jgi:hypothetical protein
MSRLLGGTVEYLNFDIAIGSSDGAYPVSVLRSPAGEPRGELRPPFTGLELQTRLQAIEIALLKSSGERRRILAPEDRAVQEFGQALFDALISGDVRSCYDVSRSIALRDGRGLRIRLRIEPPELAVRPWEFLYDARQGEFLCLSVFTPVVRYLDLPGSIAPVQLTPPLRILAMAATPDDQAPLNVERERRRVAAALDPLQEQGKVEITWLEGQTWRELQRAMRQGPWHIFHFIGHGRFDPERDEGFIELADEYGRSAPMTATQLGRLLADHPTLRMVQLNACEGARGSARDIFSGTASILVRRGIPAVLAMQYEISDQAAVEFSRSFYEALAEGLPVDAACGEARKAISLSRPMTLEWGTPVLCMRTPDGTLFSIQPGTLITPGSGPPPSTDRATIVIPEPVELARVVPAVSDVEVPDVATPPDSDRAATRSPTAREPSPEAEPKPETEPLVSTEAPAEPVRPRMSARSRIWAAVAVVAVVGAAIGAFALTRSSGKGPGAASSPGGPGASPAPSNSTPSGASPSLAALDTRFRHRSGFPFDLSYPSSWGEQRLPSTADQGEFSWISPVPGLFEPPNIFSDPLRELLASDPRRVIGAVVPQLQYGYDRAAFEQNLGLDPGRPITRDQIRVDEAQDISADRIEGIAVDPGDSGLTLHIVAYGYELEPEGGVWALVAFVASDAAYAGPAGGGALFDDIAGTISFDKQEIDDIRSG